MRSRTTAGVWSLDSSGEPGLLFTPGKLSPSQAVRFSLGKHLYPLSRCLLRPVRAPLTQRNQHQFCFKQHRNKEAPEEPAPSSRSGRQKQSGPNRPGPEEGGCQGNRGERDLHINLGESVLYCYKVIKLPGRLSPEIERCPLSLDKVSQGQDLLICSK